MSVLPSRIANSMVGWFSALLPFIFSFHVFACCTRCSVNTMSVEAWTWRTWFEEAEAIAVAMVEASGGVWALVVVMCPLCLADLSSLPHVATIIINRDILHVRTLRPSILSRTGLALAPPRCHFSKRTTSLIEKAKGDREREVKRGLSTTKHIGGWMDGRGHHAVVGRWYTGGVVAAYLMTSKP